MNISERVVDTITILDLSGKLTIGEAAQLLKDKTESLVFQGRNRVIVNLAAAFARHTFVPGGSVDLFAVVMATIAFVALQRWHLPMPLVIAASALLGAGALLLGGAPI